MPRESLTQSVALACLLVMGAVVIAGPSGLLAWSENRQMLTRDEVRNRVTLLDPRHADPDLTGELLRRNLNVVHPDEMVMLLK
jgi:hypothetical protein